MALATRRRACRRCSGAVEAPTKSERLRFGCFTAGVLFDGGFSHADDISGVMNCFPYLLGPEAWLNAARAELAMRQSGINPRDMLRLYTEEPYDVRQPPVEKIPR